MRTETENSLQTGMNFLFAARYKIRRKIITLQSKGRKKTTITSSSPEEGSVTY